MTMTQVYIFLDKEKNRMEKAAWFKHWTSKSNSSQIARYLPNLIVIRACALNSDGWLDVMQLLDKQKF